MTLFRFTVYFWLFCNLIGWGVYLATGGGIPDGTVFIGYELIAVCIALFMAASAAGGDLP